MKHMTKGELDKERLALVEAATQQLRAANQQLRATEQQLRASNQQLKASNQHLRAMEEILRKSEKKYRTLFETMSEGIVWEDHDGKIISANPAAERLLGLSLEQLQGRTSFDSRWKAIHEDGSPFPGENHSLNVAAKTGKPATGEIMGIYNPQTDSYVWLSVNSTPEFLPGETTPFRAYAVFRDITERKRAESELKQSFQSLRDSLAGSIKAMSAVVESRDPYTAGHQRRVAGLAQAIALEMSLPTHQIEGVADACLKLFREKGFKLEERR